MNFVRVLAHPGSSWLLNVLLYTSCVTHVTQRYVKHIKRAVDRYKCTSARIFRSTPLRRPNNMGRKISVRPSTKSFFDFNEIWYVGRRR